MKGLTQKALDPIKYFNLKIDELDNSDMKYVLQEAVSLLDQRSQARIIASVLLILAEHGRL